MEVRVQSGAGTAAGYPDQLFVAKGAKIVASREELFRRRRAFARGTPEPTPRRAATICRGCGPDKS